MRYEIRDKNNERVEPSKDFHDGFDRIYELALKGRRPLFLIRIGDEAVMAYTRNKYTPANEKKACYQIGRKFKPTED